VAVLLIGCFLFGGASRNDVASLIVLQPLAVVCIVICLLSPGPMAWKPVRVPLLFLGALAAVIAVQLIPLPPDLWTNLPGHGQFVRSADAAGLEQPWRSISLTPDLTLASLIGLITPLAMLVGFASLPQEKTQSLLSIVIAGASISSFVGLAQLAGGEESPFYFYETTNYDSAVGFFSNRNHQAVLLAMTWPMLALWTTLPAERRFFAAKRWIAASMAVFLLPMLVVSGSRAGLALGALCLVAAFYIWRRRSEDAPAPSRWASLLAPMGLVAGATVLVATIVLSRDLAVQRITNMSFDEEVRFQLLPTLTQIAREFFPIGAGFGSFDPVFRTYEPFESLRPSYLNHAHNELVEIAIEGGFASLALLVAFLIWLGLRARTVLRSGATGRSASFARLGLVMIVVVLLSSLVDYPLRTPLMAAVIAIASGWLSAYDRLARRSTSG
jgi:O-antigen ligase